VLLFVFQCSRIIDVEVVQANTTKYFQREMDELRKTMSREVTKTTVKVAKMVVAENGLPVAEPLEDVILIGNVSMEKAQRAVNKTHEGSVTVFGVETETQVYEMAVEDFIKHATLKVQEPEVVQA